MKQKKRVLMVSCGGLGNGGVQAIMMGIIRNLSDQYLFDMLVFTSEKRHYDDEFITYGGKIIRIPHYEGHNAFLKRADMLVRDAYIYPKVCKILRNNQYDVIHCNKQSESALLLKAAARYKIPVRICHSHIIEVWNNRLLNLLKKKHVACINKYATHKIGCSIEACVSLYRGTNDYFVVNNFYDDAKFRIPTEKNESRHFTLTQVGAFSDNKNQLFTVKVFYELSKMLTDAALWLIGFDLDACYKQQVMALVTSLGITDKVSFLSGDSDVPHQLSKSDCFIMPSKKEGFGIALVEAQAMGLICIASDTIPTITDCGSVVFKNLSESPQAWASEIMQIVQRGKDFIINTDKYKESKVMTIYRRLYEDVKNGN